VKEAGSQTGYQSQAQASRAIGPEDFRRPEIPQGAVQRFVANVIGYNEMAYPENSRLCNQTRAATMRPETGRVETDGRDRLLDDVQDAVGAERLNPDVPIIQTAEERPFLSRTDGEPCFERPDRTSDCVLAPRSTRPASNAAAILFFRSDPENYALLAEAHVLHPERAEIDSPQAGRERNQQDGQIPDVPWRRTLDEFVRDIADLSNGNWLHLMEGFRAHPARARQNPAHGIIEWRHEPSTAVSIGNAGGVPADGIDFPLPETVGQKQRERFGSCWHRCAPGMFAPLGEQAPVVRVTVFGCGSHLGASKLLDLDEQTAYIGTRIDQRSCFHRDEYGPSQRGTRCGKVLVRSASRCSGSSTNVRQNGRTGTGLYRSLNGGAYPRSIGIEGAHHRSRGRSPPIHPVVLIAAQSWRVVQQQV